MPITQISPVILTLDDAATATAAGVNKATELGVPYTFSVLDGGGNTVLVTRMDGAALASIDTSRAKARTAVYFGAATADLAPAGQLRDEDPASLAHRLGYSHARSARRAARRWAPDDEPCPGIGPLT